MTSGAQIQPQDQVGRVGMASAGAVRAVVPFSTRTGTWGKAPTPLPVP